MTAGTEATWHWGGIAHGMVKGTSEREVSRELKGHDTTREGSRDGLAILVEQKNGDQAFKLAAEVARA